MPEGPAIFTSRLPLFPEIHSRSPGEPLQLFWRVESKVEMSGARGHLITTRARSQEGPKSGGRRDYPILRRRTLRPPRYSPESRGRVRGARLPAAGLPRRCSRLGQGRRGQWASEETPGAGRCREQEGKARMRFRGCGRRAALQSRGQPGSPPRDACVRLRGRGLRTHLEQRRFTTWGKRDKKRRRAEFF